MSLSPGYVVQITKTVCALTKYPKAIKVMDRYVDIHLINKQACAQAEQLTCNQ